MRSTMELPTRSARAALAERDATARETKAAVVVLFRDSLASVEQLAELARSGRPGSEDAKIALQVLREAVSR